MSREELPQLGHMSSGELLDDLEGWDNMDNLIEEDMGEEWPQWNRNSIMLF